MKILTIATVLSAVLLLTAVMPVAEAQGGQGGQRRVTITFTEPETAAKNHTVALANGSAEAKFTVRYSTGGGGMMGGGFGGGACQPGTKMTIPLIVEPVPEGATITVEPANAVYDLGTPVPPPPVGTTPPRTTTHMLKISWAVGNLSAPLKQEINVTHKAGVVSGGQCASPMPPTTGATPGKASLNITAPYVVPAKVKAVAKAEEGFLPGPGFVVVILALGLVLLAGRRRE